MGQRSDKLKKLLGCSKRTSQQTQAAYLRAQDQATAIEDREYREAARGRQERAASEERYPGLRGRTS